MIDREHDLPLTQQAKALKLSGSTIYSKPRPVSARDLALMRRIDELHLDYPFAGARMHRISIAMAASFCVEALDEALAKHGKPEILNTDQGSQFTSLDFTSVLTRAGVAISMDGKGAWRDNVLAGQCVRRTILAHRQIRGGLPARLRQRIGAAGVDRQIPGLL